MESSPNGDIMGLNVKVNGGFPESVMMNGDIETEGKLLFLALSLSASNQDFHV